MARPVPREKIENPVPRRVDAGAEGGPRHGGHRGDRRAEPPERPRGGEARHVGELARGHEPLADRGIEPVETEDDRLFHARRALGLPAPQPPPDESQREGEEGGERREEGEHEREKGRDEGEPGAGADVGVRRGRRHEREERRSDRDAARPPSSISRHRDSSVSFRTRPRRSARRRSRSPTGRARRGTRRPTCAFLESVSRPRSLPRRRGP